MNIIITVTEQVQPSHTTYGTSYVQTADSQINFECDASSSELIIAFAPLQYKERETLATFATSASWRRPAPR